MKKINSIEEYNIKRQEIVNANSNLIGVVLNDREKTLNQILETLKEEYKASCDGHIPYDIPVLTDKNITGSRLYRFCTMMPKGADLHVHDMAQLPLSELCELLKTRDEMYINTDHISYDLFRLTADNEVPPGYMKFSEAMEIGEFSMDELMENWTVRGAEIKGIPVWDWFEELFEKHAVLSNNMEFTRAYYEHTFRYYCSRGILHMEIHLLLIDELEECIDVIKTLLEAYYTVKKEYPYLSAKIIGAGLKDDNSNLEYTKKCFMNTLYAHENIKDLSDPENPADFVIGFDLINEEDASLPLSYFAPMLLKAGNRFGDLKFFIHGGESLDARNDNLIDAYLLGVSRAGHGLNLYRYPDLLERYAKSEICLEVCVISNQTLGYTRDIRNHPAAEYLRRGVAIALCSDDPTYQENETLTDDFFAATVCWDLNIADLKHLAINSIMYSGLNQREKNKLLRAFSDLWKKFTEEAIAAFGN